MWTETHWVRLIKTKRLTWMDGRVLRSDGRTHREYLCLDGYFYDPMLVLMLWSPSHRPSANKNNDNFDKVIKVKKINNIKRSVRGFFFSYSARKGDDDETYTASGIFVFFSTDGPNSLSD